MLRHTSLTLTRIGQLAPRLGALIYPVEARVALRLEMAGPVGRISREEARRLVYHPVQTGQELSPYGSTFWFRLSGEVPEKWTGRRVDLLWASHSEGTLWRDGQPVQGLNFEPSNSTCLRPDAKLWDAAPAGARVTDVPLPPSDTLLEVEVACNQLNGYNWRQTPGYKERTPFVVEQAELAIFDPEAWEFYHDYLLLADLLKRIDPQIGTAWGGHLLSELNAVVNELRIDDRTTWAGPGKRLKALLAHRNGTCQAELSAIGHGHIDTAWLWPLAETKRKCVRTFSTALAYAGDYPEYRFACSQAWQYNTIKEEHPGLFERIKHAARAGNWCVTGGTWIEPDCNLPSGESLVRQFLYGQRFFEREFGERCRVFWNPDVFGYSGALPQIIRGAGIDYFLTQKLSWNQFTKPLHHNFHWEGIDGTRVLTHFPPGDSYNAMWNGSGFPLQDVLHTASNAKDHDRTRESMLIYGFGDGGGGPTRGMLEALRRCTDLQGVPRVRQRTPLEFFQRLEASLQDAPVMVGELYFEYHRGTYTTQAEAKRNNRRAELLLREIELLSALASRLSVDGFSYPRDEIEALWRIVLLNQFHDIIPGSSIREVYEEASKQFAELFVSAGQLKREALAALCRMGCQPVGVASQNTAKLAVLRGKDNQAVFANPRAGDPCYVFNSCAWERTGLVDLPTTSGGTIPGIIHSPGLGISSAQPQAWNGVPVSVATLPDDTGFLLENGQLRAEFTRGGQLVSLRDKIDHDRVVIATDSPGNQFVIYEDHPHDYDAWEVDASHLETRTTIPDAIKAASFTRTDENGRAVMAGIEFTFAFGDSMLRERVVLHAHDRLLRFECEADWHERHRFLKVEFPSTLRAAEATFEIQFGHVKRPTHFNTMQDIARFESCAHKWFDLSQPDYGLALLNDCKYGAAVHGSTLRLSLLRAPTYPDPEADQGGHRFSFALYPHIGDMVSGEVVRRAWEFNCPLALLSGANDSAPAVSALSQAWFAVDSPHLVIDTVKKAEDSDALIVRLYEAHGASGEATLSTPFAFSRCVRVNLLEDEVSSDPSDIAFRAKGDQVRATFNYRPFEIISLKLE